MRAWRAEKFGEAIDVLKLVDAPVPEPKGNQIQVKVSAAGVGLPDVLMLRGVYPAVSAPPVTPGQEVVGVVTAAGPDADVKVGEKVMTSTQFAAGAGGFADYTLASSSSAMTIPSTFSDEEAAGFYVPYHTGYVGLVQRGQLQAGETLLVLGGAGSSGSAAIMLGKALGATVIATASNAEKAAFCRRLGADHVVNYAEQPIHKAVREVTGNRGANVIYDPVGGSAYEAATKCVAQHGRIVLIGYGSGEWPKIDPLHVVLKSYSVVGAFAGARTTAETRAHHAHLVQLAEAGKIGVPLDKVFDFDHVPQAIDRLAKGEMLGKVVVRV
jgi:NADPH2:quinone reductase